MKPRTMPYVVRFTHTGGRVTETHTGFLVRAVTHLTRGGVVTQIGHVRWAGHLTKTGDEITLTGSGGKDTQKWLRAADKAGLTIVLPARTEQTSSVPPSTPHRGPFRVPGEPFTRASTVVHLPTGAVDITDAHLFGPFYQPAR